MKSRNHQATESVPTAPAPEGLSIEEILDEAPVSGRRAPLVPAVHVRTARILSVSGREVELSLRGSPSVIEGIIAPEVDPEVVADALENRDAVLVEIVEGEAPVVVAVLQTQKPRKLELRGTAIHIEGEEEVLLRSGRGAIRIREDGDIEIVGNRISATSRGLFRIIGRLLRLN